MNETREIVKKIIPTNVHISTKECPNIDLSYRRCGNTTRLIDFAIQKLFEGYKVMVEEPELIERDHDVKKRMNLHLMKGITRRLECEHRLNYLLDNEYLVINYKQMFISFIKEY